MNIDHFLEYPPELKIQIIRKCYAIPYVRLRRSSRFVDEFCEENRKRLGIYCYQREPQLYLVNTLTTFPFSSNKTCNITTPHVAINYGRRYGDCNFLVPMTSRNVAKIKASLSGFAFTDVSVKYYSSSKNYEASKEFAKALIYFLEVAAEFNIINMVLNGMTDPQRKMIIGTWNLEEIIYHSWTTDDKRAEIGEMSAMKNMKYVYYITSGLIDEKTVLEAAARKIGLYFGIIRFSASTTYSIGKKITAIWKAKPEKTRWFGFRFEEDSNYFYQDISEEGGRHLPKDAIYFGSFSRVMKETWSNSITVLKGKYDIWLSKIDEKWQFVSVKRTISPPDTGIYFYIYSTTIKKYLIINLVEAATIIAYGVPLDISTLQERLEKAETPEEMRQEFSSVARAVARRYSKPANLKRSPPGVIYEMVTEWWNGPKWILELTNRKPVERRHPLVHLAYVMFQEVICPVYQYCSK